LLGVGGVIVVWALAALLRRPREAGAVARRVAPEAAVLRAVSRELEQVRQRRQADGWTGDLAARALAAFRVAGSYALGRSVAQTPAATGTTPAAGQLRVASVLPGRRAMIVSGSATPEALAQELGRPERAATPVDERLRDLQFALERLGAAAYGRNGMASDSDLDEALDRGSRAVRHVARRYTWPARAARAARQSVTEVRARAWAR
jgi:hypothetical protein